MKHSMLSGAAKLHGNRQSRGIALDYQPTKLLSKYDNNQ